MSDLFGMAPAAVRNLTNLKAPEILENRITVEVRKMRDAVRAAKVQLRHSEPMAGERLKLDVEIHEACRATMAGLVADEAARLNGELARERTRIERDRDLNRTKYDREIATAERHFAALSPDELRAEALRITSNPGPMLPEILDIVSANLKALPPVGQGGPHDPPDPRDHAGFRKVVARQRLYEPERWTDAGRRTATTLDRLAGFADGDMVPLFHADGQVSGVPIGQVIEGVA